MKNLTVVSQDNKQVNLSSGDIKNMIEGFNSVQEVQDLSDGMYQDVFGYYVVLDSSFIEDELEDEAENLLYSYDEDEINAALSEQAEYICDAMVDNLREYVENRFGLENFNIAYDLGSVNLKDGIGFSITISFGKVNHRSLYKLASEVNSKGGFI